MYQMKVNYSIADKQLEMQHDIYECHITNSLGFQGCQITLPMTKLVDYETLDIKNIKVTKITILKNEEVSYESNYWNVLNSIHAHYPEHGDARFDIDFTHVEVE